MPWDYCLDALQKSGSGVNYSIINYTCDTLGNITSIKENGVVQVSYEYDAYNQLVKETYQNGDVIEYSYDNGGNLLSKTVNGVVSNSYTYGDTGWKDLLTGFNGTTITYDEIGNPQNWRDGMSFTWVNGRQLGALQKGDLGVSYSYNSDGLRVSKTVNGVKTEYVWDGSSLIGQKTGNNVLVYLYAADGLAGFQYNGVNYYYLKNGQGDVVGILNSSGTLVAKYTYDAWGKLLSVTDAAGTDKSTDASFIGNINPIRYRSYYYDTETGLYYLQSRYYDPEVGRFINADSVMGVNADIYTYNLFTYCGNNPVSRLDESGMGWLSVLGAIVTGVAVVAAAVVTSPVTVVVAVAATTATVVSCINSSNNKKEQKNFAGGYITDQNKVDQFKMGFAGAAWNGCGWVAAYNAMIMLGNPKQPEEVINHFDNIFGNIFYGAFGANPIAVHSYFFFQGYDVGYLSMNDISNSEAGAQSATACIMLYWHGSGAHYVAFQWTGQNFEAYNTGFNSNGVYTFSSVYSYITSNNYALWGVLTIS